MIITRTGTEQEIDEYRKEKLIARLYRETHRANADQMFDHGKLIKKYLQIRVRGCAVM